MELHPLLGGIVCAQRLFGAHDVSCHNAKLIGIAVNLDVAAQPEIQAVFECIQQCCGLVCRGKELDGE